MSKTEDGHFECLKCGRVQERKSNLRGHIERVHLKIKPFGCPKCDYKCSSQQDLKKHLMTHQKPNIKRADLTNSSCQFRCEYADCGKSFPTNWQCKEHQKIHSGDLKKVSIS
jgi:PR domain zinc finger protein 5